MREGSPGNSGLGGALVAKDATVSYPLSCTVKPYMGLLVPMIELTQIQVHQGLLGSVTG